MSAKQLLFFGGPQEISSPRTPIIQHAPEVSLQDNFDLCSGELLPCCDPKELCRRLLALDDHLSAFDIARLLIRFDITQQDKLAGSLIQAAYEMEGFINSELCWIQSVCQYIKTSRPLKGQPYIVPPSLTVHSIAPVESILNEMKQAAQGTHDSLRVAAALQQMGIELHADGYVLQAEHLQYVQRLLFGLYGFRGFSHYLQNLFDCWLHIKDDFFSILQSIELAPRSGDFGDLWHGFVSIDLGVRKTREAAARVGALLLAMQ